MKFIKKQIPFNKTTLFRKISSARFDTLDENIKTKQTLKLTLARPRSQVKIIRNTQENNFRPNTSNILSIRKKQEQKELAIEKKLSKVRKMRIQQFKKPLKLCIKNPLFFQFTELHSYVKLLSIDINWQDKLEEQVQAQIYNAVVKIYDYVSINNIKTNIILNFINWQNAISWLFLSRLISYDIQTIINFETKDYRSSQLVYKDISNLTKFNQQKKQSSKYHIKYKLKYDVFKFVTKMAFSKYLQKIYQFNLIHLHIELYQNNKVFEGFQYLEMLKKIAKAFGKKLVYLVYKIPTKNDCKYPCYLIKQFSELCYLQLNVQINEEYIRMLFLCRIRMMLIRLIWQISKNKNVYLSIFEYKKMLEFFL